MKQTLKTKFFLAAIAASTMLVACGPSVDHNIPQVNQPVYAAQPYAPAPAPVQAAGQPVQQDSGYGVGSMAAAAIGGAVLGSLATSALQKPETKTVYVDRTVTKVVQAPKPAAIQPTYTPKPVVAPKPVPVAQKSTSWSNRSSSFSSSRSSGRR